MILDEKISLKQDFRILSIYLINKYFSLFFQSSPCKNGICIDGLNSYICDCSDTGFEGKYDFLKLNSIKWCYNIHDNPSYLIFLFIYKIFPKTFQDSIVKWTLMNVLVIHAEMELNALTKSKDTCVIVTLDIQVAYLFKYDLHLTSLTSYISIFKLTN